MDYKDYIEGKSNKNFWFKAKFDLLEIMIREISKRNSKKRLKILSIGVGMGDDLHILKKYGDNYITDIDKKALDLIPPNLYKEKRIADACNLPFKDNQFDVVVAFDVFEHINDDKMAAKEANRVLKERGVLIFNVPAFQIVFGSHDRALDHYRRYNMSDVKKLFGSFKKKEIFYWNSILFLPIFIIKFMRRNSKPKVEKAEFSELINKLFYKFMSFDNFLISKRISPFIGLSICGYCTK